MLSRITHMAILSIVICGMNVRNQMSQSSVSCPSPLFSTDLARLLTDHRMSGLPIRAKYNHFTRMCEHTCDNSQTDSNSSRLN